LIKEDFIKFSYLLNFHIAYILILITISWWYFSKICCWRKFIFFNMYT